MRHRFHDQLMLDLAPGDRRVLPGTAPEDLLQALADLLLEASGEEISRRVPTICPVRNGWARTIVTHL
jgi:hypothetical protein